MSVSGSHKTTTFSTKLENIQLNTKLCFKLFLLIQIVLFLVFISVKVKYFFITLTSYGVIIGFFIFTRQTAFYKKFPVYTQLLYTEKNTQDHCQALYDLLPHKTGKALKERGYNFTLPGSEMNYLRSLLSIDALSENINIA